MSHCGNISIPYPFGIGKDCYLNDWYEIRCIHNSSVPFLTTIQKEVVRIDLPEPVNNGSHPYGLIRVKANITSMGCSGGNGHNLEEVLNFTGTPFSISEDNTLVAFGCNSKATLTNVEPSIVGCISSCDPSLELPQFLKKSSCYGGFKCCNARTPADVGRLIGVKIESAYGNETRQECNVAFLTDEYDQPSLWPNRTDSSRLHAGKYATIQLKWQVLASHPSFEESLVCGQNFDDDFYSKPCYCDVVHFVEYSYLSCACTNGYEGNPYTPNGCKDVDECKKLQDDGRRLDLCTKSGEICHNIPGSYECKPSYKALVTYIGKSSNSIYFHFLTLGEII
ncbi:putative wall-associated receptor kinase-like 11 isoform X2 [Capsella rubella]|uniref:putative wall-associated receptor kinase-like 11 isoform X2 n=1 Tax=Capsella rubella TaxID=81985 RepID=UPI000CD5A991|nr:putative wall-associated receptor kinase-like 11 isoform X2 [Capsella rubella]